MDQKLTDDSNANLTIGKGEEDPWNDRRKAYRKALFARVELMMQGQPVFECKAFDISSSGIGMIAQFNLASGTTFAMRFGLPLRDKQTRLIQVSAVVSYSIFSGEKKGFKVGLRFSSLSVSTQAALDQYLAG